MKNAKSLAFVHLVGLLIATQVLTYSYGRQEDQAFSAIPLLAAISIFISYKSQEWASHLQNSKHFRYGNLYLIVALIVIWVSNLLISDSFQVSLLGTLNRGDGLILTTFLLMAIPFFILISKKEAESLGLWLMSSGVVLLLIASIQNFKTTLFNPIGYDGIVGTFLNTNSAAAYFSFLSIFTFYLVFKVKGILFKTSLLLISIWAALISWQTKTIQGPLLVLVGAITTITVLLLNRILKKPFKAKKLVLASTGFSLFLLFAGTFPKITSRLLSVDTFEIRVVYWKTGLRAITDHLLFGVGFGNFESIVARYRDAEYVNRLGDGLVVDDPHSLPIWSIINLGIIPILLMALSLFFFAKFTKSKTTTNLLVVNARDLVFSITPAIVLWAGVSYFQFEIIFLLFVTFLCIQRIFRTETNLDYSRSKNSKRNVPLGIMVIILSVFGFALSESSVPLQLTTADAQNLVKDSDIRCPYRIQLLQKLQANGVSLNYTQLNDIALASRNCLPLMRAIYSFFILSNEPIRNEQMNLLVSLDPYGPKSVSIALLHYLKGNDLSRSRNLISNLNEINDVRSKIDAEQLSLIDAQLNGLGLDKISD